MNINNELNMGSGYVVCSIENIELFKKLRNSFVDSIKIKSSQKKDIDIVRKQIAKMSKSEINRSMIDFLTFNKNLS